MPKNKHESFAVTFNALPYLQNEAATPTERAEAVFVQSHVFADSIFAAIVGLNDPLETGDKESATNCTHHLALIGAAFVAEMNAQFQEVLEIAEDKSDAK